MKKLEFVICSFFKNVFFFVIKKYFDFKYRLILNNGCGNIVISKSYFGVEIFLFYILII